MKPLPHHDNRNHLRRDLVDASQTLFTPAGQKEPSPWEGTRTASMYGSSCAYNLAAAIQWVALNIGGEQADQLAAWLSESLTNGDDDGLNDDLTLTGATS